MHVLGFLLTKHTEKLENNKCYCQVTNLDIPIVVVSKEQFQGCGRNFILLLPLPLRF